MSRLIRRISDGYVAANFRPATSIACFEPLKTREDDCFCPEANQKLLPAETVANCYYPALLNPADFNTMSTPEKELDQLWVGSSSFCKEVCNVYIIISYKRVWFRYMICALASNIHRSAPSKKC